MSNEPLTGGSIRISVDKPSCGGVVITGLEVVEAAFGIIVIATVAERVLLGQFAGCGEEFSVGIVGVGRLALMPFPP